MKHISWRWTLLAVAVLLVLLYAVWDFAWVHLIHSEAVDHPAP
ncbi:MAG TPA: hypothetical protein VHF07_00750 [Nitrospiraceae bacterium]|nr:hypothetical protein [Nitrospiraceae bacterium]